MWGELSYSFTCLPPPPALLPEPSGWLKSQLLPHLKNQYSIQFVLQIAYGNLNSTKQKISQIISMCIILFFKTNISIMGVCNSP